MRAIATGLSDVGLQREHNEDSFVVLSEYDSVHRRRRHGRPSRR